MPRCQCCEGDLPCDLQVGAEGSCCGESQPSKQTRKEDNNKQPEQPQQTVPNHGAKN